MALWGLPSLKNTIPELVTLRESDSLGIRLASLACGSVARFLRNRVGVRPSRPFLPHLLAYNNVIFQIMGMMAKNMFKDH